MSEYIEVLIYLHDRGINDMLASYGISSWQIIMPDSQFPMMGNRLYIVAQEYQGLGHLGVHKIDEWIIEAMIELNISIPYVFHTTTSLRNYLNNCRYDTLSQAKALSYLANMETIIGKHKKSPTSTDEE